MTNAPLFRVGDSVRVNEGIFCPDDDSLAIAGWQGRVTDIDLEDSLVEFDWDSHALLSLPDYYIRDSEIDGDSWQSMILEFDEVSPCAPRETPEATEVVFRELMTKFRWEGLHESNPGIISLLAPLGNAGFEECLEAWVGHLSNTLHFPFESTRFERMDRGPVAVGEIVEVIGIVNTEDEEGLFAKVKLNRRSYSIPLRDLEATDSSSSNYQALNDYVVWFANR